MKKGCNRRSGKVYAIKIVDRLKLKRPACLFEEISILSKLDHPNVIQLHDLFIEPERVFLVTEYMKGGDLFDRIAKERHYNEDDAKETCRVLFGAVAHIHSRKIAHRDLKPENILLSTLKNDSIIKIADFGFAKYKVIPHSLQTECGTPKYMAPEILKGVKYDTKADIWSLGVITFVLLGGYYPFLGDDRDLQSMRSQIKQGRFKFRDRNWKHISDEAKQFVASIFDTDPNQRPSAELALQSEWLSGKNCLCLANSTNLKEFKRTNNTRKLQNAYKAVLAVGRFQKFGIKYNPKECIAEVETFG